MDVSYSEFLEIIHPNEFFEEYRDQVLASGNNNGFMEYRHKGKTYWVEVPEHWVKRIDEEMEDNND